MQKFSIIALLSILLVSGTLSAQETDNPFKEPMLQQKMRDAVDKGLDPVKELNDHVINIKMDDSKINCDQKRFSSCEPGYSCKQNALNNKSDSFMVHGPSGDSCHVTMRSSDISHECYFSKASLEDIQNIYDVGSVKFDAALEISNRMTKECGVKPLQ